MRQCIRIRQWPSESVNVRQPLVVLIVLGAMALVSVGTARATGTIGFESPAFYRASPFSGSSVYGAGQIASGDVDGDGDRDLVVSDCDGSGPLVLPNDGTGRFGTARRVPVGAGSCVVGAADLDGDGSDDVVAGSSTRVNVAGTWYPMTGSPVMQVAFADFDRDTHLDVAVLTNSPGMVTILSGRSDGTFVQHPPTRAASLAMSFTVGDFDGDDRPDVAVGDASGSSGKIGRAHV